MKSSNCHGRFHIAALLVASALGCDLLQEPPARTRSTTSASRPAPTIGDEAPPLVENTTAAAEDGDTTAAPVPCAATDFHYPAVEAACASDGRRAAKNVMRGAIAKAKSAGTELKCANCHEDQVSFRLRSNAVEDLAKWLE